MMRISLTRLVPLALGVALFTTNALAQNEGMAREALLEALKRDPTHAKALLATTRLMLRDNKGPEARALVQHLEKLYLRVFLEECLQFAFLCKIHASPNAPQLVDLRNTVTPGLPDV